MNHHLRRPLLAAPALVLALSLTACGGDDDKASPTPSAASSSPGLPVPTAQPSAQPKAAQNAPQRPKDPAVAPKKVVTAFAKCMRKNGVNVPNDMKSWTPSAEESTPKTQKAVMACMHLLTAKQGG
ncbi:hypothetical protein [Spirillospora sp. CA-294931]|uniref:hypothetical protein n=1 Tax=Spirillospora sp. CA-294931 TaxID=3240042 RepID=UPI003D8E29D5